MKGKTKNTKRTSLILICSLVGYILYSSIGSPQCKLHSISNTKYDPQEFISDTIEMYGGLPKTTTKRFDLSSETTYPVKNWEIFNQSVHQNGAIILGSDKYNREFDMKIEFEDGDEKVLTWSQILSGYVFCPLVIEQGSFEPGAFKSQP